MWKNTSSSSNPVSPTGLTSPATAAPTYRLKYQGRRFAQIVKLKPECEEQYRACHAQVWPEVLKQIKDCNIEDCELSPPLSLLSCPPIHLLIPAPTPAVNPPWRAILLPSIHPSISHPSIV